MGVVKETTVTYYLSQPSRQYSPPECRKVKLGGIYHGGWHTGTHPMVTISILLVYVAVEGADNCTAFSYVFSKA